MNTTLPTRIRPTARLFVLDEHDRVLLFHISDSRALHRDYPGMMVYWVTPGGGVDPGESYEEAARRELWEETGFRVDAVGPCVLEAVRILDFEDRTVYMQERFFLVRVPAREIDMSNMLPYEIETHGGHRWWSLAELSASNEIILPAGLPDLLAQALQIAV
jgi:8-oxo-dGTP diphosphatase